MSSYLENLIFDIGMHIGQDTEFYLKKGFSVVAVEPNPELVKENNAKFRHYIEEGRLSILDVGVRSAQCKLPFYINARNSAWSSFDKEIGQRGGDYTEIMAECIPLKAIFSKFGCPYYLKIDTEGHESKTIEKLFLTGVRPKYISIANANFVPLNLLYESGYTSFKMINQAKVPGLKCPSPALEGTFVDHEFMLGSSGLFGEETPEVWQNFLEISAQIKAYWETPSEMRAKIGWFDLHARL